ncbi:MAG: hypothetical protein AAF801_08675 [Pseudomonadota bacterium]
MRSILLASSFALLAGQGHALSCIRPDPIATFKQLAGAPENYFVLYGEMIFDEGLLPPAVSDLPVAAPDPIPAQFRGKGLTRQGFTSDYISPVTLEIGCAGPWCGSARSGGGAIYFVEAKDPPVTMVAGACGGRIFTDPSQAVLDMLVSCMQGGPCSSQPLQ